MNTATIIRAKHDKQNKYFMMRRETAQDDGLSWAARGVLCYLLSKPDNWEIKVEDLQQNCGESKIYRILKELKKAGYLQDRSKKQDEKGRWSWTPYVLYETPQNTKVIPIPNEEKDSIPHFPQRGNRNVENRDTVFDQIEEQSTEDKVQKQAARPAPAPAPAREDISDSDFAAILALLESAGIVLNSQDLVKFKEDAKLYSIEEWGAGVNTLKERQRTKTIPKPFAYLMPILQGNAKDKGLEQSIISDNRPELKIHIPMVAPRLTLAEQEEQKKLLADTGKALLDDTA